MSKGILLFAHNNEEINYCRLAEYSAKQAIKHLGLPVTLITDLQSENSIFDKSVFDKILLIENISKNKKYFHDGNISEKKLTWNNSSRFNAFNLSPYDETLVIDVDYIINSDLLKYSFETNSNFLIYNKAVDLSKNRSTKEFEWVSEYSIPFYWATVFFFKKTEINSQFFSLIEHIKENWTYYKLVYQITSSNFRNDYAFSIAVHMMNGFTSGDFVKSLPGKLFYVHDTDLFLDKKENKMNFLVQHKTGYIPAQLTGVDVHIMNKYSLLRYIENE